MKEKPYHHGNLHTALIEEGLALIHEEGRGNFSLRKLAKRLGVSPAACYNHYATAEELLGGMKDYVTKKFSAALLAGAEAGGADCAALHMGRAYVDFFAKNPHYFSFLYDNADYRIELTEDAFEGDFEPFRIFRACAAACMERSGIGREKQHDDLIAMWAAVHGLAAMANMKGFHYEGDWGALTLRILDTKLNLY